MMPEWEAAAEAFTSGTTKGTSGFMRKALELSITTAPASTALGANTLEIAPPAEARTISIFSNERSPTASTGISSP